MHTNPGSPQSDAYRTLRINIEFSAAGREIKTLAITSAYRSEGKTTTALNLAVAYAQVGMKVLLIDADLRKPSIHQAFGMHNSIGLTSVLSRRNKVDEAVRETDIENLSVLPSGPVPVNPSELLASKLLEAVLGELKPKFDVILIDTSPALSIMDARIVAAKSDGVLLVMEYHKVKREEAARLKEDLASVKANILGVALNKINNRDSEPYPY